MKILFAQNEGLATAGGTEKVCVSLANAFAATGNTVFVATNDRACTRPFFPLDPAVCFVNLDAGQDDQLFSSPPKPVGAGWRKKAAYKLQKLSRQIRRVLRYGLQYRKKFLIERSTAWKLFIENVKPDVVVTMSVASLLDLTYGQQYALPIVNSSNGRPDYDYIRPARNGATPRVYTTKKEAFSSLTGIQVLFDSYRQFLPDTFSGTTYVIPNAVPQVADHAIVHHTNEKKRLVITMVARLLCSGKQQDFAIRAFALLAEKYPQWDLTFWGEGPDRAELESLIQQHGLVNRVFLKGVTTQPLEELKQADIFVFPSRYEGFGLALAEAMSIGLPVIGLASCSGVNELIRDSENGFLVNTQEEFVDRLGQLMHDASLRNKLGQAAHGDMKQFSPESIFTMWEKALHDQISSHTFP